MDQPAFRPLRCSAEGAYRARAGGFAGAAEHQVEGPLEPTWIADPTRILLRSTEDLYEIARYQPKRNSPVMFVCFNESMRLKAVNHCIHHIPGRIRVRVDAVKRCAPKARAIQGEIQAKKGVNSVEVNIRTGSILILYNPGKCDVTGMLSRFGIGQDHIDTEAYNTTHSETYKTTPAETYNTKMDEIGQKFVKTIASYLLELAVERAAFALIAAVL